MGCWLRWWLEGGLGGSWEGLECGGGCKKEERNEWRKFISIFIGG
jgi:hypothetical protein